MKVSIFLKSRAADFGWLEVARDSIRKFCKGFHEVVLCLNEGESFDWPEAKIVYVRESFTGYNFQQAIKTFSDTFCTGDYILFSDSDVCFTREVTPEEFFQDGKPIWIIRPYGEARPDQQIWRGPSSAFIGQDFPFEGMYRHPHVCPVTVLQRMRGFCQFKHGVSLDEYIRSKCDPSNALALVFSEFNAIAAFAYNHCKDQLTWVDASKDTPRPGCTFQSHTHGPDKTKYLSEFRAKFRELLGDNPEGLGVVPRGGGGVGAPALTIQSAIEFIASQVSSNVEKARIIHQLKTAWKGRGTAGTRKKAVSEQLEGNYEYEGTFTGGPSLPRLQKQRAGKKVSAGSKQVVEQSGRPSHRTLLCIHSYPGGNETFARHWPNFQKAGANRIVGIGTTDGKCRFGDSLDPLCESVNIGKNQYIQGTSLVDRLTETVEWCLTQPEDRFLVMEYDVLVLKRFPSFEGVCAHLTGTNLPKSQGTRFHHGPWGFTKTSGPALLKALKKWAPKCNTLPDNSPDVFFGVATEKEGIEVRCPWKMFTRNSLDQHGDLELAIEEALDGAVCIHGVKNDWEYNSIMDAMKNKQLSISHAA